MLKIQLQSRLMSWLIAGFSTAAMAGNYYCPSVIQIFCPAHSQHCTATGTIPSPWAPNSASSDSIADTDRIIVAKFTDAGYTDNPSFNYAHCHYKSADMVTGGSLYATSPIKAAYPGGAWQDTTVPPIQFKNYKCPSYDGSLVDPIICPFIDKI